MLCFPGVVFLFSAVMQGFVDVPPVLKGVYHYWK